MAEPEQLDLLPPAEPKRSCGCSGPPEQDVQLYPRPFNAAPGCRLILTTSPGASDIEVGLIENHGGDYRAVGLDADAADRLADDLRARATALREQGRPGLEALGRAEHPGPGLPAVLSSVEDVARVATAAGFSQVRERTWFANPQITVAATETGIEIDSLPLVLDVQFPAPTPLVWSAIQAARSGEPG